jgi:hypothetical protein
MNYEKPHITPYGKFLMKVWKEATNITFGVIENTPRVIEKTPRVFKITFGVLHFSVGVGKVL